VIRGVQDAILKAIEDGIQIIDVRYDPDRLGDTIAEISDMWAGYDNVLTVDKSDDDGSTEILEANAKGPYLICGINLSACVKHTVNGLREDCGRDDVNIVANATGDPDSWGDNYSQETLEQFNEILV
jgi:hypothetical protein